MITRRGGFCIGQTVRVAGRGKTAKIVQFLSEGGAVLDRALDGFSCWNVKDLIKVDGAKRMRKGA
jgi:hypothetical protein